MLLMRLRAINTGHFIKSNYLQGQLSFFEALKSLGQNCGIYQK